ncbi:meiosis 1 arrest protein isoform X1 [Parasteatoda tepidariorum]|uniref:meiosis 1 arrest protein isoform X1 n=1 Tax=Parasteatoda tepidariorum TaxID=114398 RepID=UPI001C71EFD0|nr:meiosis 1 arrest protein isoform X1 [Parasteatoda tepidariorum]
MEKQEWREAFQRQPTYYIFFDLTPPMSISNITTICQVLQDTTILVISMKGSSRFSVLGVYVLSGRTKCIFPFQSLKQNYTKFQFSLECMKSTHTLFTGSETFETSDLSTCLQHAIQQYETYFQGAVLNKEEWPQLQVVFFTAQPLQRFTKQVKESLQSIELGYIRKVNVIMLRNRLFHTSMTSSESKSETQSHSSQNIFDNDVENTINSLLHAIEVDANSYQLENVMKCWLHDCSTDSDHLRIVVDKYNLRCDLKECFLNIDSFPVHGHFSIAVDSTYSNQVGRANPVSKQNFISKVPVLTLEAVAVVRREGLCESLLFGHPFIATATQCWKLDWDELERCEQEFTAIVNYLYEKNMVLLTKKRINLSGTTDKVIPAGHFVLFPSKNALLVKSVVTQELLLPLTLSDSNAIPEELTLEVKESMEKLEKRDVYNPVSVNSGLYRYLLSFFSKNKSKASTSFVVPIINKDEGKATLKKRRKCTVVPVAEVASNVSPEPNNGKDFMTASTFLKKKFLQNIV